MNTYAGLNALEAIEHIKARKATALVGSLRHSMYGREGVAETDFQIGRGLKAWAIVRTGSCHGRRQTAIVFGKCRSDALRRASAPGRLGEEIYDDVTLAAPITSDWDEPVAWPAELA